MFLCEGCLSNLLSTSPVQSNSSSSLKNYHFYGCNVSARVCVCAYVCIRLCARPCPCVRFPGSENSTISCYGGCLSSTSIKSQAQSIPALMDVDLACELRVRPVGDVPSASLSCRLKERDGKMTLSKLEDWHVQGNQVRGKWPLQR